VIRAGDSAVASFNQIEPDIKAFMRRPWVMTGSDASAGHPRAYGTFARKYSKYVAAERVLTLRQFIERSSALTADTFGLAGRGRLAAGGLCRRGGVRPPALRGPGHLPRTGAAGGGRSDRAGQRNRGGRRAGALTGKAAGRALPHRPTPGTCP
jgi:hypothetical protein